MGITFSMCYCHMKNISEYFFFEICHILCLNKQIIMVWCGSMRCRERKIFELRADIRREGSLVPKWYLNDESKNNNWSLDQTRSVAEPETWKKSQF